MKLDKYGRKLERNPSNSPHISKDAAEKYQAFCDDNPEASDLLVIDSDSNATLMLYGSLDSWPMWSDEFSAKMVAAALKEAGGRHLTVRINSPGGEVFEGASVMELLKNYSGDGEIRVDGLAASAATMCMLARSDWTVVVGEQAQMMIHEARVSVYGATVSKLQSEAQALGSINESIKELYLDRSNMKADAIKQAMSIETWYSADQMVEKGFAAEKSTGKVPDMAAEQKAINETKANMKAYMAERGLGG